MSSMLWFMLGCWIGCGAGFLLCALVQMQRPPRRVVNAPVNTMPIAKPKSRRLEALRPNLMTTKKVHLHA